MENARLFNLDNDPVPPGEKIEMIKTRDGVHLRTAYWMPTANLDLQGRPRGTVCLFQGFSEFIEKYYEVIRDLRRRGFVVATLDWRGQGLSDRRFKNRKKGHVRSFKLFQRDLEAFIEGVVKPNCPPPYYALAHSMGAHNIFAACAGGVGEIFDRAVLSAPMLHLAPRNLLGFHMLRARRGQFMNKVVSQRPTRWATGFLRSLGLGGMFAPGASKDLMPAFEGNVLTSDRIRFERTGRLLEEFPELGIGGPTVAWLNSACKSMRRLLNPNFQAKLEVPTLIIAAGSDQVVSTPALEKIGPKLRIGHHVVIRGSRHEILMETNEIRDQFWAAFDAFVPGTGPRRRSD